MSVSKSPSVLSGANPAPAAAQAARQAPGTVGQQQVPVRTSVLNVPSSAGPPLRVSRPSAAASSAGPAPGADKPNYSRAHIAGKPFVPAAGPESIRAFLQNSRTNNRQAFLAKLQQFLGSTLSNTHYESINQLHQRAEDFLHHFEAEKEILAQTKAGLKDPQSPVHQQATWMAHLERLNWKENAPLPPQDRESRAREIEPGQGFAKGSAFENIRISQAVAKALSMMLEGQEGPFTEQQAFAAFELAQLGSVIASRLQIEERMTMRDEHGVYADRQGTGMDRTPTGMDLSKDLGTQLRDEHHLPVMTGTSGSSSDAALSTKFASMKTGLPWAAPGLDNEQAQRAMADLALQFFRGEGSAAARGMAYFVNQLRRQANLPAMHVDSQHVFTHSYPEVDAGVRLTLQGKSRLDKQAMTDATLASARRLSEVAANLPSSGPFKSSSTPRDDKPNYSRAHIDGKPFVPNAGPESIRAFLQNSRTNDRHEFLATLQQFLGSTLSNNRYGSIDQLHQRAENFLHHFQAEKQILAQATADLKNPQSPLTQQATWMAHLERLNWKQNAPLDPQDREQRAREIEPGQGFAQDSPFSGLKMTGAIAQTMAMMLAGKQGPFTEQQALSGFELAQLGTVLAHDLGIEERVRFANNHGVYPWRNDTHPTRSPGGVDLSEDLGTQIRDEHQLPVMLGTSGTSSDAAQSAKYASMKAGVPWAAPGLTQEQALRAMSDLGLRHFRGDGSTVSSHIAEGMNLLRTKAQLAPMQVDAQHVFTHTLPEIEASVMLTMQGQTGFDEQAMRKVTLASAQRLSGVAAALAVQAEQTATPAAEQAAARAPKPAPG